MVRAEAVNDDPIFLDLIAAAVMQTWNRYRSGRPLGFLKRLLPRLPKIDNGLPDSMEGEG